MTRRKSNSRPGKFDTFVCIHAALTLALHDKEGIVKISGRKIAPGCL